ncbi:MAG: YfhO family protein [Patescibacteria group bacterium]
MGVATKKIMMWKKYWPFVVIFLVWFIFASPYFFKGLVPFPSKYLVTFFPPWSAQFGMPVKNNAMPDVITQIYPWKMITIDSWKQGQIPLWNPYSFSGTPHAANYQTAVFSPVNLLYFVLPFLDAWSVSILLQPLLAGIFMYFLLRSLDRSKEASLIGSIAFMFCGFLTVWMAYGTLGWAVLWLPLLFAAVVMHVNKRSWWNPVIVSLGLAWSFFSGHFQMSVYVLVATVAFIVYQAVRTKRTRASIELGLAVVFGLMLAAVQILPSLDAYSQSVRSELFTQGGGIAWQYLITLFAPDFYGNPVTRNDWFGFYAEWASYIGVVPLLLSVYAVVRRTKHIGFFLGLALMSFFVATPTPINTFVIWLKIPGISTSYAARIIVLTSFSLAVIAAYGLDRLREDWEKKKTSVMCPYFFGIAVLLGVLWCIVVVLRPFDADKLLIAKRNILLPTVFTLGFCALAISGYIRRWKFIQTLMIVLFIVLVAADMLRYAGKWMPFDPREYVYPEIDMLSFLKKEVGFSRIFGNVGGEVTNGFALSGIEGYDAVYQKRYGEFIRSVDEGKIVIPERSVVQFPKIGRYSEFALQLLGVRYVAHRLSDGRYAWAYPYWQSPYYKSMYKDNYYEVFVNEKALPRAFLASAYSVADNDKRIIDALYQKEFDPRETLVLEREPVIQPQSGEGSVEIKKYTANEIVLQSKSSVSKLLFLSDVYDNGWRATVDGQETRIDRADYDFRAVALPSGDHVVRMVYWPKSFVYGLWVAAIGILCLFGLFLSSRDRSDGVAIS